MVQALHQCSTAGSPARCLRRFSTKWQRVRRASPHGRRAGWDLRPVIVKSGDDCRQELLAAQLIAAFHCIWKARPLNGLHS